MYRTYLQLVNGLLDKPLATLFVLVYLSVLLVSWNGIEQLRRAKKVPGATRIGWNNVNANVSLVVDVAIMSVAIMSVAIMSVAISISRTSSRVC